MRNEDELMIALDIIKTYSEAAQLNGQVLDDTIKKIENVRHDIIRTSQIQAKETVKSELSEPLKEFTQNADKFWSQGTYLVNELKYQSEKNRWRNGFILGMAMIMLFGFMILGVFMWLPSLDEIKQRRSDYVALQQYGFDISNCDGKKCIKVEKNKCNYGEKANYCIAATK